MTLLTPGYWHSNYWLSRYWQQDYWLEYGTGTPPAGGDSSFYYLRKKQVPKSNRELLSKIKVLLEQIRG